MSSEQGQVVLVSGSSSGIGRAISEHLLAGGWSVLGWDKTQSSIEHPSYQHTQIDLMNVEAVQRALVDVKSYGFIHAAGIMCVGRLGDLDLSAGSLMWSIHDQCAAVMTNALIPHMVSMGEGRVIFIGSRVSQGMPGRGQYAATKAALVAMARSWAAELAPTGVTVNVVSPAATATAMLSDPDRAGSQPRLPPIGRLIEPIEIAALVSFLLTKPAAAMTGQELTICGGSSLHL